MLQFSSLIPYIKHVYKAYKILILETDLYLMNSR